MLRYVFFAVIFTLSSFVEAYTAEEDFCNDRQYCRVGIRHIEKGGIGYEKGYTTLETFLSPDPSQWIVSPFLDARGHIFDNGRWAANAGIGLRTLWRDRVYGINTYYDYRNVHSFHSNQAGIGFETLGALLDFRINGYLPIGVKTSNPYDTAFATFSGNYMLVSQKYHSAMKGANAELGFHLGKTKLLDFYAAAGPYYFIGEVAPSTWGGKARILGTFNDVLTLEISDSYDKTFYNRLQGQITLSFPFGPRSKSKKQGYLCKLASMLNDRMLQPVYRQEIILIDNTKKKNVAINPDTGLPFFFVFVDNTSASQGTYESPYPTLTLAQENSSPNNIIYVFPGDGTTTGMDSGISLQANQKFWGSGVSHLIQATQGTISIPALSSSPPIITNTDFTTDGNVINLATNNAISGFTMTFAVSDAIFGADPQRLEVSSCIIENVSLYAIQASFSGDASIALTNNQFLNNVNGISLTLHGTSTIVCSDNAFSGQTSVSDVPLQIAADNNVLVTHIENNVFNDNTVGSIRMSLDNVLDATINVVNNTITDNGSGSQGGGLESSFVILTGGTIDHCSILLNGNTFSGNTGSSLYLNDSGTFTTLNITASANTMSDNEGSGLALATPTDILTLLATGNVIRGCNDNGITIGPGTTTTGNITINNNSIMDIGSSSNGILINQNFSALSLTILNNVINNCEGTGIISYAPIGISFLTLDISDNTITNCDNVFSMNAAAGIDIEQYVNLTGSITNNTLSGNTGFDVVVDSTQPTPTACLFLTGNDSSNGYRLSNPDGGTFLLSPCNVETSNIGTIDKLGTIDYVQSCSNPIPCPP